MVHFFDTGRQQRPERGRRDGDHDTERDQLSGTEVGRNYGRFRLLTMASALSQSSS